MEDSGELGQAKYLTDVFGYLHQENVTRVFWYSLLDNVADGKSFGLIGTQTVVRPAYNVLQNLTKTK